MERLNKGDVVRLNPTTKRHKQVIREHGALWVCEDSDGPKMCFNGERGVFITPLLSDMTGGNGRNVRLTDVTLVSQCVALGEAADC